MKKHIHSFIAGVVVSAVTFTSIPAIAASLQTIEATLNSVNIEVNGKQISAIGEDYTLANGQKTAGSIVYNQTTYVPIRRVGELLDVEIGWNQQTGSVTIGEVPTPAPDTPSDNYADWTAEEEAAYQEFKGMWSRNIREYDTSGMTGEPRVVEIWDYTGGLTEDVLKTYLRNQVNTEWYTRILHEVLDEGHTTSLVRFFYSSPQHEVLRISLYQGIAHII